MDASCVSLQKINKNLKRLLLSRPSYNSNLRALLYFDDGGDTYFSQSSLFNHLDRNSFVCAGLNSGTFL